MRTLRHAVPLVLLASTLGSLIPRATAQEAASQKTALIVWGGWAGHQPKETVDIFAPWLEEQGFEVEISNTLDSYLDAGKMSTLTLVVQSVTMGQITAEQERGLLNAIRGGVGLAGWHGGLSDAFRSSTEYEFMVGGSFAAHPGGAVDYDVHLTKRDDPILQGLQDFSMHSEQYYMLMDPSVDVMATTTFSGKSVPAIAGVVMPVVWKKLYGKGRVFHSTLGHAAADFTSPEARTIMQRGMLWAARVPGTGGDPVRVNPYRSSPAR